MSKLLLLIWGMFSIAVQAETITGKVIGVADGDTLTMRVESRPIKIRLAGIDAPEITQDFGKKAKHSLVNLVFNKTVTANCRKKDKYQRSVCVVYVDGKDVGLEQIRSGMAWWYRRYTNEQTTEDRTDYESAEASATAARKGLWLNQLPTPPWEWRKSKKQNSAHRP